VVLALSTHEDHVVARAFDGDEVDQSCSAYLAG
jgi:hypothetical protein